MNHNIKTCHPASLIGPFFGYPPLSLLQGEHKYRFSQIRCFCFWKCATWISDFSSFSSTGLLPAHSVKSILMRSYFWSYFLLFSPNPGKYRPETNSVLDTFHAVASSHIFAWLNSFPNSLFRTSLICPLFPVFIYIKHWAFLLLVCFHRPHQRKQSRDCILTLYFPNFCEGGQKIQKMGKYVDLVWVYHQAFPFVISFFSRLFSV